MLNRRTRAALMAGAATLSLSVASYASEFSRVIVFGDRQIDAGQSPAEFYYLINDERVSDGRRRWTDQDPRGVADPSFGNYGNTWAMQTSAALGHGVGGPSQPSELQEGDTVGGSGNYAANGYGSADVLNSITGTATVPDSLLVDSATGDLISVEGVSRPGLLTDETRTGWAANSIVIINGGSQDIRELANVDVRVDGPVYVDTTRFVYDEAQRTAVATNAATNIATGALAMSDAGAGLVVVSNLFDQGATPEAGGDAILAAQTLNLPGFTFGDGIVSEAELVTLSDAENIAQVRTEATTTFNQELSAQLDGRDNVIILDQHSLVAGILDNPGKYGLSEEVDHRTQCAEGSAEFHCLRNDDVEDVNSYFFLNGQDLTRVGHEMLAQHAAAVINAPVQISGIPYTAIASGREVANAGTAQVVPERIGKGGWAPFVSGGIGHSTWNDLSGEGRHGSQRVSGVAGLTYDLGNGIAVGAAASYQNTTEARSDTGLELSGDGIYGTVYAGADFGLLFGTASATVGNIDYDRIARQTSIGTGDVRTEGDSDASVFGASIEVGVRALTHGVIAAGPIASLDHWSSDVSGYRESGWDQVGTVEHANALEYEGVDGSSTRGSLGMFLEGGNINNPDMPAVFRFKALYTREFNPDGSDVTARLASSPNNSFTREGRGAQADSITIGAQLTYDFGPAIGSIGYDARIGEADDHSGRIDVSVPFGGK